MKIGSYQIEKQLNQEGLLSFCIVQNHENKLYFMRMATATTENNTIINQWFRYKDYWYSH